ncbi:hypothetical protein RHGRI_023390 [Rhododendron griersonianum]|uniref:Protein kinase domain-containing protein n=1 Tax=Rhododendron griersonianum TaxID=479676 RepID=A0AAV6J375_9ERIC|nr:hypothetical protein RHGRI_023390 [Rhododendron griersonianum]
MEWVRGEVVGRGSFGTVNLAIPRKQSTGFPQFMAVKSCGSSHSASLMTEKSILDELGGCPQIIRCFGSDFSIENGEKLYNLLLEYASGGNLAEKIKNPGCRSLPESEVRRYTKSVLRGLQHIHKNGFVHCDIKLQNILLCSGNRNDVAKIADFGLAKKAGEEKEKVQFEVRGTPLYMAPETVSAGEIEPPADVWGLGCLVAEMVAGAPAWQCSPSDDVCKLLMRIGVGDEIPEIPGDFSEEGKDFLGKCFLKDPTKRWTAEMLLNHPFVVDQDDTVPLDDTCEASTTGSPTGPFDFPDWESPCSITSLPSPDKSWGSNRLSSTSAERLRRLVTERRPDWSVLDSWVTVR